MAGIVYEHVKQLILVEEYKIANVELYILFLIVLNSKKKMASL